MCTNLIKDTYITIYANNNTSNNPLLICIKYKRVLEWFESKPIPIYNKYTNEWYCNADVNYMYLFYIHLAAYDDNYMINNKDNYLNIISILKYIESNAYKFTSTNINNKLKRALLVYERTYNINK